MGGGEGGYGNPVYQLSLPEGRLGLGPRVGVGANPWNLNHAWQPMLVLRLFSTTDLSQGQREVMIQAILYPRWNSESLDNIDTYMNQVDSLGKRLRWNTLEKNCQHWRCHKQEYIDKYDDDYNLEGSYNSGCSLKIRNYKSYIIA